MKRDMHELNLCPETNTARDGGKREERQREMEQKRASLNVCNEIWNFGAKLRTG